MSFKIVSTGWNCEKFLVRTLASVAEQENPDWQIAIMYDPSDDNGAEAIRNWCALDPDKRKCRINDTRQYAVKNQYEAITQILMPEDNDIIIFLDLDDSFAHKFVLDHLNEYYSGDVLVTYGQYRPIPPTGHVGTAKAWPFEVVKNRSYRQHVLGGETCFNHLRTVKGKIHKAIPESYFKWANGDWYQGATDYAVMIPAFELADGRYRFVQEVLVDYHHDHEFSDNKQPYSERQFGHDATADILMKAPLQPLKLPIYGKDAPGSTVLYMSAEQRREVLSWYGRQYKMNIFIESGTNDGGTPWRLKDEFKDLYTIELARDLWAAARQRFMMYPQVHCMFGDSTTVLKDILEAIDEPALLWLDGHYSGGCTAHGDLDTPVRQELEMLFEDGRRHVILVDDARIFIGGPEHFDEPHYHDYPSLKWVEEVANENGYDFLLKDDIMRLTPR